MKQAIMTEPGKIKYVDVPVPEVGSNEIKIKMKVIGVCGSDIHVWHGQHPFTSYPVVQGHEISGIVEEVGENVSNFSIGDIVTVQPQVVCGECYPCTHGLYNDCEVLKVMGFQTTGLASEYFVVDAKKALKLPQGMSLEHGAMIEPLAVAVHAVWRFGDIKGKNVLITGGGPIGNLVAQAAKAMGASNVLLSEISKYRLEVAEKCGITTVNPKDKKLKDAIADNFGKDGADVIFECIGNAQVIKEVIDIARKGSEIIIVGVVSDLCEVNMGLVQDHELTIKGSAMYRVESWIEAIRLANEGLIEFDLLITHRVPFSDYSSAYNLIEEQKDKAMKVLIDIDK